MDADAVYAAQTELRVAGSGQSRKAGARARQWRTRRRSICSMGSSTCGFVSRTRQAAGRSGMGIYQVPRRTTRSTISSTRARRRRCNRWRRRRRPRLPRRYAGLLIPTFSSADRGEGAGVSGASGATLSSAALRAAPVACGVPRLPARSLGLPSTIARVACTAARIPCAAARAFCASARFGGPACSGPSGRFAPCPRGLSPRRVAVSPSREELLREPASPPAWPRGLFEWNPRGLVFRGRGNVSAWARSGCQRRSNHQSRRPRSFGASSSVSRCRACRGRPSDTQAFALNATATMPPMMSAPPPSPRGRIGSPRSQAARNSVATCCPCKPSAPYAAST